MRGAIRRTRVAAVRTTGSKGLMWLAARISGPCRSDSGTSPLTSSRARAATASRAVVCRASQKRGARHVVAGVLDTVSAFINS